MPKIRVTKKFNFEMSHALLGYDGLCKNIHGHSYKLRITLFGSIRNEKGDAKDGMVMDFHQLKLLVNQKIVDIFDHSLVINANTPHEQIEALKKSTERLIILDFQPSTENLCVFFC
jgi:6-pyruvoyltetrahydropterin/6-carboxytetrahydropterin synthase